MPYRIDIAGGWLDQPFVSKYYPGAVITVSIEPTIEFNDRSGMATSTRRHAIGRGGRACRLVSRAAKVLFAFDNPPGTKEILRLAGREWDCIPGLNKSWYEGEYWPGQIESINDEPILRFVEKSIYLLPLGPRVPEYQVIYNTRITCEGARALSDATEACWQAILEQDVEGFGKYVRASFEAQIEMFPDMVNDMVFDLIRQNKNRSLGWKLSGAVGGGYLILISDRPVENGLQVIVRREEL
jgi:hypothetical protein